MYLEDNLNNNEFCRNLKGKILTQYGREIMKEFFIFERHRWLLMKKKTDLTFFNRCRDSSIIQPKGKKNN